MTVRPDQTMLHYRLVEKIGAGGMGEVWRAVDTTLDRDVAVKILPEALATDAERLARFEREAKVLASLNHPNVATVHGYHDAGGVRFLVMELVPGETLEDRVRRGAMPVDEAVAVARKIVDGIEYAHERGIVHRDLKPANVKLTPDGGVKVLDFGLAKAISGDPSTSGPTSTPTVIPTLTSVGTVAGMILGTAAYMSPEQARGTNVDRRSDIWAFGAVLWEMLTGRRLFEEETASDTLAAVLRAPIEWSQLPASLPAGLVRLLKRCLERDPKKRLRDIGEARIVLESPMDEAVAVASPPAKPRSASRALLWMGLAALIAVTSIAIVGILKGPKQPAEAPVVRFQIAVPEGLTSIAWPRVSPDGTMIAFQGRGPGPVSIWVRRLDALEARPLPGTEGAARHWWSPDSRYVAFFNGNQLKKVPAVGGPAQLIAEGAPGADGTWGAAGTILFDGRAVDPISGVSASGGASTQMTTPDPEKGEAGHAWPFFLPDGKHFLFLAMPSSPEKKATIKVAALGETGSKDVVPTSSRVEYAAGHIFYVLDGTLMAQRFDVDKLAVTGEPVPVAERLGLDVNAAAGFSTSADGTVVYLEGALGELSDLVWVDRAGRELAKIGETGAYRDLSLSPDGTKLAYALADPRTHTEDIWVRDLKREIASRVTFGTGNEVWPIWSPDGTRVAFGTDQVGGFTIYDKDANGAGTERRILAADAPVGAWSWSRDGRWMAILYLPPSRRAQIKLLPMQGEPKLVDYLVADSGQGNASFSPDGKYVAYTSNESGQREVYVQTLPIGGGKWQISSGGADNALWRADGRELIYKALSDEFVAVPIAPGPRFDPGAPQRLFTRAVSRTSGTAITSRWAVTPDGQRFVLNAARETRGAPVSVVLNWPATLARE